MAAPKGNQFWKMRSSFGRKPKFATADDLWLACEEYFAWVVDTPLYEDKIVSYKGKVKHVPVAKMRAMTLDGLYTFIDLDPTTWRKYRTRSKAYAQITSAVERIIRDQKFAGAAADLLNANIIARDLGLADKSQIGGDPDSPIIHKIERRIVRPGDTNS